MRSWSGVRAAERTRQWVIRRVNSTRDGGFVLLESIVAISLISVIMAAFTGFFVNGIASTNHERARQAAAQIANSSIETIRSLPASSLVAGTNTVAAVDLSPTVNNIAYTVSDDLTACAILTPTDGSSANCATDPAGSYLRAVVTVTWKDSSCQNVSCTDFKFQTSTLLSTGDDPRFDPNQATGPTITNPGNQISTVGQTVSPLRITGSGVPTLIFNVTAGGLPSGLVMNTAGVISGSPTTIGSAKSVTVTVTDGWSTTAIPRTAPTTFTWTVVAAPTVTAPPNQVTTINTAAKTVTVARTCPNAPCTFTMTNAPVGLSISNAGVITGTPTVAGTVTVTVTITDNGGMSGTSATFTWAVLSPASVCVPTSALPNGSFEAPGGLSGAPNWQTGGSSPVLWDTTEPDNILELWGNGGNSQSANGGVPITAQEGTQWAELNANQTGALYQNLATVPGQVLQWSVWHRARAVGGNTAGRDVMQVQIGSTTSQSAQVPTGQTTAMISDDASAWRLYQGVYTVPSGQTTTRFQFAAISTSSGDNSVGNFIDGLALNNYIACLTTPVLPQTSTVNTAITPLQLSASRGSGNYLWGVTDGNPLPAGLNISASGLITGTPTATGTSTVVLTLTDKDTNFSQTVSLDWTVYPQPTITAPANQTSLVGDVVNLPLSSSCPNSPCAYVLNSGPSGLAVSSSGVVYGTVTAPAQPFTASVTITDAAGATATTATFNWTVSTALAIASQGDQTATKGVTITALVLSASGGAGTPYTWTDPGNTLPAGLSMSTVSNQGRITGRPTTPGTYSVQLTVKDSGNAHTSTINFTWTIVYPVLVANSPGDQDTTVNRAIIPVQLSASGGSGTRVWSRGATLPAGLTMTSAGLISGTPTAVGSPSVTLTVTDATAGYTQDVTFTWNVDARPTVSAPGNQTTANNTVVRVVLTKSCANTPCSYTLNGGPAGLSINSNGVIRGTVTSPAQTFAGVTVTVTDQSGATATSSGFTWTVTTPLVGRWAFDETSGTTAADSGGAHPATLSGAYGRTSTSIQGANALTVGGTSGAAVTSGTVLDTSKSFTVAGWVKLNNLNGSQTFFSQDGANISGFYLQLRNGKFSFIRYASDSSGSAIASVDSVNAAVAGQWYHLAGVFDATASTLSLYVNGALQGTPATYSTTWNATGNLAIGRGKYNGNATDWANGVIDDGRAYSGALSSDAVAQIAQAGYWNLDEGSGTTAADGSLNGYDGTLAGGASWTAGVIGVSAAQFNGSTGLITSAAQTLDTSQSYSVTAWAKTDISNGAVRAVATVDGTNIGGFRLQQRGSKWAFVTAASDTTSPTLIIASSTADVIVGQWYQLVGVYDGVAKTITLYVNGVKQGASVAYTTAWKATGKFVIGRSKYNATAGDWWNGAIDDVAAYQLPLDQAAITALAVSAPPTPAAPTATAGAGSATVNWAAPADIAGSPVTGYVVTPYLNGAAQAARSYNTTATAQTLSGLTAAAAYTFTVAAVNANATSAASPQSNAVVPS